MKRNSCSGLKQAAQTKYPVRLWYSEDEAAISTALMYPNALEVPSISTYSIRTRNSLAFFLEDNWLPPPLLPLPGGPPEGSSFCLRRITSLAMIRSSSCLDLDSPIALSNSKNSFERFTPPVAIFLFRSADRCVGLGFSTVLGVLNSKHYSCLWLVFINNSKMATQDATASFSSKLQ